MPILNSCLHVVADVEILEKLIRYIVGLPVKFYPKDIVGFVFDLISKILSYFD